jgi:hypothetical protein
VIILLHFCLVALDFEVHEQTISLSDILFLVLDLTNVPLVFIDLGLIVIRAVLDALHFLKKRCESFPLTCSLTIFFDEAVDVSVLGLFSRDDELSIIILRKGHVIVSRALFIKFASVLFLLNFTWLMLLSAITASSTPTTSRLLVAASIT